MKLLPILVNGQTNYMVDFESQRNVIDSFIIATDTNGLLLNLYEYTERTNNTRGNGTIKKVLFQEDGGEIGLGISNIEYDDNQKLLSIKLDEHATETNEGIKANTLLQDYVSDSLRFNYIGVTDAVKISVKFIFGKDERMVNFYLAPASQIRDAVIDSGSEATQIALFKRDGEISINNIIPILDDTLVHFKISDEEYAPTDFIQAETEEDVYDSSLFKSKFFVKKEVNKTDISSQTLLPNREIDSVLKMLMTSGQLEDMRNTHIQLYNMKIASFGGVELPKIKRNGLLHPITVVGRDHFYYRKYLNVFLYEILTRFCDEDADEEHLIPKLLSLYVLMPNVYTPQKAQEVLDYIRKDLEEIIKQDDSFKERVIGFNVTSISESDASLVGAISLSTGQFDKGRYLIMDAGKGTLDFSMTEKDENGKLKNIMKSGIVGASAAIGYGFMLDLLQAYLKEREIKVDNIKEFIFGHILGRTSTGRSLGGGDLCYLNNLMEAVDAYKIRYETLDEDFSLVNEKLVEDGQFMIESFILWIKECQHKISIPYTNAIVETIVLYSILKIATSVGIDASIDYVVFAGRGFLYKDLKTKMLDALKSHYNNIQEKTFISVGNAMNNKNVCLFITKAINEGAYNYQLLPKPYGLDNGIGIVEKIQNIENESHISQVGNKKESLIDKIRNLLTLNQNTIVQNNYSLEATDNDFTQGYSFEAAPNKYLVIGGAFYHLAANTPRDGNARIFHSNGKILIRYKDENRVDVLNEIPNLATGLAFPSLFPFCAINSIKDIYIPNILTQLSDKKDSTAEENKESLEDKKDSSSLQENVEDETMKTTEKDPLEKLKQQIKNKY